MIVLEKIRNKIFWIVDFFKGSPIKKHIYNIKKIVEFPESEENKIAQDNNLNDVLKFASTMVPYYSNLNSIELTEFPVVNKNIIRDNLEQFIAKGQFTENLIEVVTSGSTGTPFRVYHDKNKKNRNTADTFYFANQAGFSLGEKLVYFKIWTQVNSKSKIKSFIQNIDMQDVMDMSDKKIDSLVKILKRDKANKGILGYASALEAICRFLDSNNCQVRIPRINSVIAMSEGLNSYTKEACKKYFSTNVVSRYSNVENGILAQQIKNDTSNVFVINWASYFIEVLELESNNIVPLGKPGRIVVTDLYNYAMPMIRYDTGDIGILNWDFNKKRKVLSNVEGRKMDMVYDTSGNLISSFTITNNMWLYTEIKQYQFIQRSEKHYLFKLNLNEKFTREEQLINEFKGYLGQNSEIEIEYVDEIPLLNSGKRRKVVNLHKKTI